MLCASVEIKLIVSCLVFCLAMGISCVCGVKWNMCALIKVPFDGKIVNCFRKRYYHWGLFVMLSLRGNGKSQGALHGVERIGFQNGERLFDVSRTGAERPWREKRKISSLQLRCRYL